MKVDILRTPGLDLTHDLGLKGVEVPPGLVEGQTGVDVDDDVAEKLIAAGVAGLPPKPAKQPPAAGGHKAAEHGKTAEHKAHGEHK